eukprot:scaffold4647_cov393-Prasinococcus_capsulatus_cf.AAC.6
MKQYQARRSNGSCGTWAVTPLMSIGPVIVKYVAVCGPNESNPNCMGSVIRNRATTVRRARVALDNVPGKSC